MSRLLAARRRIAGGICLLHVGVFLACLPPGRVASAREKVGRSIPASFQGLYRIRAEGGGGRMKARAWIAVDSQTGRLSAEVLGPMGGTRAQLDASLDHIRALLVEEDVYLDEPSDPRVARAVFGVPVRVEEFISLLRGRRPGGGRTPPVEIQAPEGTWRVDWRLGDPPVPEALVFEGPGGRLDMNLLRWEQGGPPAPFSRPDSARRVDAEDFQSMFLP